MICVPAILDERQEQISWLERMDKDKVISIESLGGPLYSMLRNVMRMVPERDQADVALQRLLAFRLRIDGEGTTREYLMRKIRDMIQCRYTGRLYDFLKNDQLSGACAPPPPTSSDPPESA
ncbi:MAG: hypothetical protein HY911_10335 [Desulfobacterales bacterium]|nr:hypothetical protein [Desulfobacterales bacterium]